MVDQVDITVSAGAEGLDEVKVCDADGLGVVDEGLRGTDAGQRGERGNVTGSRGLCGEWSTRRS